MQGNYMNLKTEDLVVMYQNTKAEDLLSEIVERNKGLIYSWARDYRNIPNYDEEDLVEEAVIACWKAVGYYDPAKGLTFSSCLKGFVTQCYNRIYNQETRGKRYNGTVVESYEEIAEKYDTGCVNTDKCYFEDYTELEMQEFLDILEGTTKQVALLLLTGLSKREVADELQITPATTTYHVKKIGTSYNNYKMCLAM